MAGVGPDHCKSAGVGQYPLVLVTINSDKMPKNKSPQYPYAADIEVAKLRLDVRNPRLPAVPDSQREAFGEIAEAQGSKLLALCRHIARYGLSPAQRFIVIPDDENQFIVLDANRRLTALRALEQPDLLVGRISETDLKQLRQLSDGYTAPEDVPCVVFAEREDADKWVELLHDGESEGAGLVPWSAQQKARHRARSGTKPPHLQVLDFVRSEANLSAETIRRYDRGSYPVSTLERALTTPRVREKLGIDIEDGQVVTRFPKSEVLKGLTKLVDEIGRGDVKVNAFMRVSDRTSYVDRFDKNQLPNADARLDDAEPLNEAPDKPASKPKPKAKDRQHSTARTKVVPAEFSIAVGVSRINDIYLELKRKLRVDEVPNATGVLLRVFVELSVDEYMDRNSIRAPKDPNLGNKVGAVADHMEANAALSKKDLIPVREAVKSPDKLTLATNLNALVHNRRMTVTGTELKAIWDRLAIFVEALWR